jgi:hypothetical protein
MKQFKFYLIVRSASLMRRPELLAAGIFAFRTAGLDQPQPGVLAFAKQRETMQWEVKAAKFSCHM